MNSISLAVMAIVINIHSSILAAQGHEQNIDHDLLYGTVVVFRNTDGDVYYVEGHKVVDMANPNDTVVAIVPPGQEIFFDRYDNAFMTWNGEIQLGHTMVTKLFGPNTKLIATGPTCEAYPINLNPSETTIDIRDDGWVYMDLGD